LRKGAYSCQRQSRGDSQALSRRGQWKKTTLIRRALNQLPPVAAWRRRCAFDRHTVSTVCLGALASTRRSLRLLGQTLLKSAACRKAWLAFNRKIEAGFIAQRGHGRLQFFIDTAVLGPRWVRSGYCRCLADHIVTAGDAAASDLDVSVAQYRYSVRRG